MKVRLFFAALCLALATACSGDLTSPESDSVMGSGNQTSTTAVPNTGSLHSSSVMGSGN